MISKNILITGCSSGIGLCSAQSLQQQGYNIVSTVRTDKDVAILQKSGLTTTLLDLDCSNSIQQAIKFTLEHFDGQIDALFNNAAYGQPGAVEDLTRDVLRQQFETNLFGTH